MNKIFSFCNQKGGVGKTTSILNIGTVLANRGYKVLVLDMDAQGNATSGLGEEKPPIESTAYQLIVENTPAEALAKKTTIENLWIIPSSVELAGAELELIHHENREFRLSEKLKGLSLEYDFILIDCPPSLGLITINCLVSSRYMYIPLQCEYYALEGLGQLLHTYQLVKNNLNGNLEIGGVLLTMADKRTNLTQQVIAEVREYFKEKVFQTVIPRSVRLSEAPSFGKPAVLYDPQCRGSQCYMEAGKEFIQRFAVRPVHSGQNVSEKDSRENSEIANVASDEAGAAAGASVSNETMNKEESSL